MTIPRDDGFPPFLGRLTLHLAYIRRVFQVVSAQTCSLYLIFLFLFSCCVDICTLTTTTIPICCTVSLPRSDTAWPQISGTSSALIPVAVFYQTRRHPIYPVATFEFGLVAMTVLVTSWYAPPTTLMNRKSFFILFDMPLKNNVVPRECTL